MALEFCLLLPFLLMLLLGVTDMGRLVWTMVTLDYATATAARCAAINTTTCGAASQVTAYAATQAYGMTVPAADFVATAATCGSQVTAAFPFIFVTPWITPASLTLSASACYPTQP